MPFSCFACFGGSNQVPEAVHTAPVVVKTAEVVLPQDQLQDDTVLQELQKALSKVPAENAEARISQIAALVLHRLHACVVRLYGWAAEDAEEVGSGSLVLLAVDWQRPMGGAALAPAGPANAFATPAAGTSGARATPQSPRLPPPELPDLPGQRVPIAAPAKAQGPAAAGAGAGPGAPTLPGSSLLQQAVHKKSVAAFTFNGGAPSSPSPGTLPPSAPPDCASDHILLGATAFAALPLTSGDRLLGVMWIATNSPAAASAGAKSEAGAGLPPASVLRQVSATVSMCLVGGVDPEYLAWLSGSLRRLAASATLQAMVGELCDATAQHVRRRFLVDAVAHAAVVPDARSTVGFMLDHRPQPGGPGGVARWAGASRQASVTYGGAGPGAAAGVASGAASGVGGGGGAAGRAALMTSGNSFRRSDSLTNPMGGGRGPQRTNSHTSIRAHAHANAVGHSLPHGGQTAGKRSMSLMEQATTRAGTTGATATTASAATTAGSPHEGQVATAAAPSGIGSRPGGARTGGHGHDSASPAVAAAAAAAVAAGAVPSLRAKGFQLSHTLLQRMVTAGPDNGGRGPDGVYGGLAVADCGRHVQDVHQPSRDVCMLMAGGVRGADMTTDASDSNMFASERSTGRIAMQSLVLVGLDVGATTAGGSAGGGASAAGVAGSPPSAAAPSPFGGGMDGAFVGGGGGGGAGGVPGAILAVYLAFPNRLPPLLVANTHASCRTLLSLMFARLVRRKVATDLEAEFQTLCSGVPGSYAVVPSHGQPPAARDTPAGLPPVAAAAAQPSAIATVAGSGAAATGLLDASGLGRTTAGGMVLEHSIGAPVRASSCKLVPLSGWTGAGGPPGPGMSLGASAQLLAAYTDAGCRATHGSIGVLGDPARPALTPADASGRVFPQTHDGSAVRTHGGTARGGSAINGGGLGVQICQDARFTSHLEVDEDAASSSSAGDGEEGDVMLSSDPRIEEGAEVVTSGADPVALTARTHRTAAAGGSQDISGSVLDEDDLFPLSGPGVPRVPAQPAAVLTVSEADGTSSMRQHMGLLVESLMSTLRSTAAEDPFESSVVSARRSLDLELDDLRLSGVLGDGGSGVVLCGMLGTVPVAVKIIQMPEIDQLLLASTVRALGHFSNSGMVNGNGIANGAHRSPAPALQQQQQQQSPLEQQQQAANGGGGGVSSSMCSSKLKQARRDMLRNAMELAVMRSISHVNIATVYAVYDNVILERVKRDSGATAYALRRQGPEDMQMDTTGSKPVFVALCMELCDSGSLASKLEERSFPRLLVQEEQGAGPAGRTRSTRVLDMVGIYLTVLEVSCALRYLHARRLLHRDIKSANILLKASPTDPRGWTCKLADFGSALVLDQFQSPEDVPGSGSGVGSGEVLGEGSGRWFAIQEQSWGTITHMSPESMDNNSRVDASSDIFALGIVMWEICSGRGYRPYKELAPEQIGAAVRKGLRPTFTSEVPLAYRALAQQCWAAEPHKRPSAVQVVAQVKHQLSLLQSEARVGGSHRSPALPQRA